jgi:AAA15 family ATPase/GTPase
MDANESHGTQKAFYLAGPILDVLGLGKVLIIDEMEARLHPLVTQALIGLFNSLETNPKRAQLIFTTHDTNLL